MPFTQTSPALPRSKTFLKSPLRRSKSISQVDPGRCFAAGRTGALVLGSAFILSHAASAQVLAPGVSTDGNIITISAPGGIATPSLTVNGSGAGSILFQGGASQASAPANNIQITAPSTVNAYTLTLPPTGPDALHPLLAFGSDGTGYFAALPAPTVAAPTSPVSLGANTFNAPQTVNGGSSSLPLVISSSSMNGASIALDNSSVGGIYTLLFSNASQNAGLWDYTHFRDTLTCSQTSPSVSCGATHLVSTSAQPAIAADLGAGIGASVSFGTGQNSAASDQSGSITVATGSSPAAGSVIASINFAQPWARTTASQVRATDYAPACTIGAANAAAASLSGPNTVYAGVATTGSFSLFSNSSPLAPGTTYVWTYKCM